jgi:hypothetical protein
MQHSFALNKLRKVSYTWNGVMISKKFRTPLPIFQPILLHPYFCEFFFAADNGCFLSDSFENILNWIFIALNHEDLLRANICPSPYYQVTLNII